MISELSEYASRLDMMFKVQIMTLTLSLYEGELNSVHLLTKETVLANLKETLT